MTYYPCSKQAIKKDHEKTIKFFCKKSRKKSILFLKNINCARKKTKNRLHFQKNIMGETTLTLFYNGNQENAITEINEEKSEA